MKLINDEDQSSVLRAAERLPFLYQAKYSLKNVSSYLTADVAPGSARKVRSALKSIDGAIRNALRFSHGQHIKIRTGLCLICGHHGMDCEGTLGDVAEYDERVRAEFPESEYV